MEVRLLPIKQHPRGPSWVIDSTEQPLLYKVQLKVVQPKRYRNHYSEAVKSHVPDSTIIKACCIL